MSNLLNLPIECIKEIFKFNSTKDICALIKVNNSIQNILKDTDLILDFSNITLFKYDSLRYFKNIISINLSKTNITDEGLRILTDVCQGVHNIDLRYTDITDEGLKSLEGLVR